VKAGVERPGKASWTARTWRALAAGSCLLGLGQVTSSAGGGVVPVQAPRLEQEPLSIQRAFIWDLWARTTRRRAGSKRADFEDWYTEDEVFSAAPAATRADAAAAFHHSVEIPDQGAPVISYSLYNRAAYAHIREHHLYETRELERLRVSGAADRAVPTSRSVPQFPRDAIVMKTVWWPVAQSGATPLPVWDAEANPPRAEGNGYLTWRRVVLVSTTGGSAVTQPSTAWFGGHAYARPQTVPLEGFYWLRVDERLAAVLRADTNASKAVAIALGRPIHGGDYLVLVGVSLASRAINDWVWAAFWWHDRWTHGVFAADRPASVTGVWSHFLMDSALDSNLPRSPDGTPHVCFNPWLEARFPDLGSGGGTESNCMTCHRRAAYPASNFLPVTRGKPDTRRDPAFAPGTLRTSFLWSLARRASATH
jgi:hypothetical protein